MSRLSSESNLEQTDRSTLVLAAAAWHSLLWLVMANVIGVWLAFLLLAPAAGAWMGEWTYGRWMPVHLNFQLYGWMSLPLVAWLMKLYGADKERVADWSRAALWIWSAALTLGAMSWLGGHSSGKLFLDWTGYVRVFFPLAILFLWVVFAYALALGWKAPIPMSIAAKVSKLSGLILLLLVPFAIYAAADPSIYPPVNPDSGGPTGASQLESVLIIVLILFVLPYGLGERRKKSTRWIAIAWVIFVIESLLCLGLGRGDISHHRPTQFISLGSLLLWVPLIPAYYSAFVWEENSRMWRKAVLCWWAVLIPTGWCLFLPGVLDHLKFTDGLVSHSLMAMAGFVTSLLILVLTVLLGRDGEVFDSRWAYFAWHGATLVYVAIMLYAGWIEGYDPTFTMIPSKTRNVLYWARLICGVAMTGASANWLLRLNARLRQRAAGKTEPLSLQAHRAAMWEGSKA